MKKILVIPTNILDVQVLKYGGNAQMVILIKHQLQIGQKLIQKERRVHIVQIKRY